MNVLVEPNVGNDQEYSSVNQVYEREFFLVLEIESSQNYEIWINLDNIDKVHIWDE